MHVITARNVHDALPEAIYQLISYGAQQDSRNGPVLMFPTPVTTLYRRPAERVLFWPERDANPFFHLFEALWMLAGRDDVEFPARYASNIRRYSDDGERLHGAYGYRWRHLRGIDQLELVVDRLSANPRDRRQVTQMFDAELDLLDQDGALDIPCNLVASFQVSDENRLDMLVACRSNDIIWGCYGANAVHFSVLQEYLAARIGVGVGRYWQVSHNWHGYLETLKPLQHLQRCTRNPFVRDHPPSSPYEAGEVVPTPLLHGRDSTQFDEELQMFVTEGEALGYRDPFIRRVALPMMRAHRRLQQRDDPGRFQAALAELERMPEGGDWRHACIEWVARREARASKERAHEAD